MATELSEKKRKKKNVQVIEEVEAETVAPVEPPRKKKKIKLQVVEEDVEAETEAPAEKKKKKKVKAASSTNDGQSLEPTKPSSDRDDEGDCPAISNGASRAGRGGGGGKGLSGRGGGKGKGGEPINSEYRLFVGGIPWDTTEETLRRDFEECGKIVDLKLLQDRETGESRGVAFITFADETGCKAALAYDGDDYGGRVLNVAKATGKGDGKGKGKGKGKDDLGPKPEGCKSVVVKKLSEEVTKEDLLKVFKRCGNGPSNVGLLTDKATGKSRCTARLDFQESWELDEAIKLNGSDLKGMPLCMHYCVPKW